MASSEEDARPDSSEVDTVVHQFSNTTKYALAAVMEHHKTFESFLAQEESGAFPSNRLMKVAFDVVREASTVIVFGVLTLEAFINFYAVRRLGKKYAERYVDRLDLVSKWVIVPQLVLGHRVVPEGSVLTDLRALVTLRNSIAHPKAGPSTAKRVVRGLTAGAVPAAKGLWDGALLAASVLVDLSDLLEEADPESHTLLMRVSYHFDE